MADISRRPMKIALLVAMLAVNALAQPKDVRIVNGIAVDLEPLHHWLAKQEGERPLKHWKVLQIKEVSDGPYYPKCRVSGETEEMDIGINNLPPTTKAFFDSIKSQSEEIGRLSTEVKALDWEIQHADAVNHDYNMSNPYGPTLYVKETARQTLRDMRARLDELQSAHSAALASSADKTTIIAMFTGKTYAGLQVWDCGRSQ